MAAWTACGPTNLATRTEPNGDTTSYLADGLRLSQVTHAGGNHEVYTWAEDASHTVSFQDASDC